MLFAALPEYSTPAVPVTANQSVEPAVYNNLKNDFCLQPAVFTGAGRSPQLPALLGQLTLRDRCTFPQMHHRVCASARQSAVRFSLHAGAFRSGSRPHRISRHYAGRILLAVPGCARDSPRQSGTSEVLERSPTRHQPGTHAVTLASRGIPAGAGRHHGEAGLRALRIPVPDLSELLRISGVVARRAGAGASDPGRQCVHVAGFPNAAVCLTDYRLPCPRGGCRRAVAHRLAIFIRLWRKLRTIAEPLFSFTELSTSARPETVQQWNCGQPGVHPPACGVPDVAGSVWPAACDPATMPGATGADRSQLLALWVGSGAKRLELGGGAADRWGWTCMPSGISASIRARCARGGWPNGWTRSHVWPASTRRPPARLHRHLEQRPRLHPALCRNLGEGPGL